MRYIVVEYRVFGTNDPNATRLFLFLLLLLSSFVLRRVSRLHV